MDLVRSANDFNQFIDRSAFPSVEADHGALNGYMIAEEVLEDLCLDGKENWQKFLEEFKADFERATGRLPKLPEVTEQMLLGQLQAQRERINHLLVHTHALGDPAQSDLLPGSVAEPGFFDKLQRLFERMQTSGELAAREEAFRQDIAAQEETLHQIEDDIRRGYEEAQRKVLLEAVGKGKEKGDAAFTDAAVLRQKQYQDAAGRQASRLHAQLVEMGDKFRKEYEEQQAGAFLPLPVSLIAHGRKSSPQLFTLPTLTLFDACHALPSDFLPSIDEEKAGLEYKRDEAGTNRIRLEIGTKPPPEVTNAYAKLETIQAWISAGEEGKILTANLSNLDEMAWDIAALAVTAFYTRTDGQVSDTAFPLLIDDYFAWRNVPPVHRTRETRREIVKRIELLASDAVKIIAQSNLHLPDPTTGRKTRVPVITRGAYLDGRTEFWVSGQGTLPNLTDDLPDGYITRLGGWAAAFVQQRSMIGFALKRLGEYNLRSQLWERQIGWYVTFQMNIQATKTKLTTTKQGGKTKTEVIPQHSLKMETVLNGAHIRDWEEMARVNPGRVVQQWNDVLRTLHKDGITDAPLCLDGEWDGSDLRTPTGKLQKGALAEMRLRRYAFVPGPEGLKPIQARNEAAKKARQEAARHRAARQKQSQ